MYDRSVWIDEVDRGLYNIISSVVAYKDKQGKLQKVKPRFSISNTDIDNIQYPVVLVRTPTETFDMNRYDYNNNMVVTSYDMDNSTMTTEDLAKPYNLTYQIDFIAQYKEDLNLMLKFWYNKIGKRFMLPVVRADGEKDSCYMYQQSPPSNADINLGKQVLYRIVLMYTIQVEIDMGETNIENMITSVNLNINS